MEQLWSKPEVAVLNAKYTVLVAEMNKNRQEIQAMSHIYSNITDIKSKLGDIHSEIDQIDGLKKAGETVIIEVKRTMRVMNNARETMDSKLREGLKNTTDIL